MNTKVLFIKNIFRVLILVESLFLFNSCSSKPKDILTNSEKSNSKTTSPPISILIKKPIILFTDSLKQPEVIHIPTSISGEYRTLKTGEKIKITPPSIKKSNFLSQMQNYTTDNGLALDGIASAIKDKNGNLWFGTFGGGVSRYDGKSFTNYTTAHGLANNFVYSVKEDKKGNLWFGTSGGGLSKYDGKTFRNYTTKQGLANDIIRTITEDRKGNIWIGTNGGGVSKFDGKKFINFSISKGLANNIVRSIAEDKKGNIWFGTDMGVSKYDGKNFTNYTTKQGLPNNFVSNVLEDKKGNIWFGTNSGASKYDGKTFKNYSTKEGLINDQICCLEQDSKGNIWFGTNDGGASSFDGKTFTNFTSNQGLVNNVIKCIVEDNSGNIWFGTNGGGLSRYDGKSFINFTTNQGLSNNIILSIAEDKKGNLWYGTFGNGVLKYDGKEFTNYTTSQGLSNDFTFSITKDNKGELWFTSKVGVSHFDGEKFTNYTTEQGLINDAVISSIQDKKGNFWFGTLGGGVSKFNGKSFVNFNTSHGLAYNVIITIMEDSKGNIWFGTNGGGVSKYDGKSFINYTTKQGLSNDVVLCIKEDKFGNIWFGTHGNGVSRFDGESFLNFSKTEGLPDNTVSQIIIDSENNMMLGTNYGVARITNFKAKYKFKVKQKSVPIQNNLKSEELKKYLPVLEIYNSSTGFPVKDVNAGNNAMFKDKKGIIWIATGADKTALVRFNYHALNKNKKKPSVFIHSIKINNENICWNDLVTNFDVKAIKDSTITQPNIIEEVITNGRMLSEEERDIMKQKFHNISFSGISKFYPIPKNLVLPNKLGNVVFDFGAVEPAKPYLVKYKYKLEGYDESWSPITNKTSATFGNIFEGNYTFLLKAQNPNGIWSDQIEYNFTVLPPWWRTWWMYTLYIIFAIGIVGLIVWINGQRLRASALELTKEIKKATSTIVEQKQAVEEQKIIVEKKNRDITDSINYALRIQDAFLPKKETIQKSFPESFILFQPKDIVSGDFYYFHINEDKTIIAAVDCTGHGVPGAFMSMIGSERLTDAVIQSSNPNEILTLLNIGVKNSLHQTDKDDSTRDGMDIAICSIDMENLIVNYAGANRPLWIIRKDSTEIEEIKANKVAIGGLTPLTQEFIPHKVQLQKGDTIYMTTDGYGDIFSDDGKKLKTKKLKEILIENQDKSMPEQEAFLVDFAEKWKNGAEQIDDILIIGIRF